MGSEEKSSDDQQDKENENDSDDQISEIRKRARKQYETENADVQLTSMIVEVIHDLKKSTQESGDIQQKRQALKEMRMAQDQVKQAKEEQRKLSEYSAEELINELGRILEEKEEERNKKEN